MCVCGVCSIYTLIFGYLNCKVQSAKAPKWRCYKIMMMDDGSLMMVK